MKTLLLALLLCAPPLAAGPVRVKGLLTGQGATVLDSTNAPRQTFSSNEKIGFSFTVYNGALDPNRISFTFSVIAPNGNKVFVQTGNATPGTVGNAAASITGLPISGFYQGPGNYTLKAIASLSGTTIEADQTFTISSPNVLLIYPPNGSTGLTDNPLTFQWFSSGATTYRVTVADNQGMYNPVYQTTTAGGTNSFTYPTTPNPTDPRQALGAGTVYYWKIEGLDINGNVVASSQVPFSFTVASVALTRDIAVTGLDVEGPPDASGMIPFRVTVKNQGSTIENAVPLKVTLGGLPAASSPITMPVLSPGDVKTFDVTAQIPTDQVSSLAIACVTIFDDNSANNCKTLNVSRPTAISTGTLVGQSGAGLQSADQIWQAIENILTAQGMDLSAYQLTGMEGTLSRDELLALLDQLRQGVAQVSLSGPPLTVTLPPVATAPGPDASGVPVAPGAPPPPSAPSAADETLQTPDAVWNSLVQQLKLQGVDLSAYQLVRMDGTLTQSELTDMLAQLRSGTAETALSGPPLATPLPGANIGTAPAPAGPLAPPVAEDERPVPPPAPGPGEEAQEWAGYTRPLSLRTETLAVRDAARWKRLWERVAEGPVPTVDFTRSWVIAILGGRGVPADRVEIVDMRGDGSELIVRYKVLTYARMGRPNAPPLDELGKTFSPYLLKVVRNDFAKVRFELVKENANE
jgi:hypothetical protein